MAVLVWYWGKDGFSHRSSGRAGLLFDLCGDQTRTGSSDSTWKTAPHLAFGNSLPPHPNYRLPEHNIRYDARLGDERWIAPGFDDTAWPPAEVLAPAGGRPWGTLIERPIPMWYDSGLQPYTRLEREVRGDTLIVRAYLPQNSMITPYLSVRSRAGNLIDIRTDNYRGGSEPNIRTEYITTDGEQTFESPAFFNGHYVVYRMPADVVVQDVKYRETRFDTDLKGTFVSSDSALNQLHRKAVNTLRVGLRDHIHDCPDRERAQWWGDVVITMGELFYVADTNAHRAVRKAMRELVAWQKTDSALYSPVPAGNWKQELPAQMLASVGRFGFWHYYQNTADRATIVQVYPAVKKYLSLYQTDSSGLVVHREGGWMWHDWGQKIDVPVLDNAWYYVALDGAARMAKLLDETQDYERYIRLMSRLKPAFQRAFWTGTGYRSAGYKHGGYDDRAQGMAVVSGLSDAQHWATIRAVLDTTLRAGAYLEKYILEAYFQMSDAEAGLARMKKRYARMIDSPLTTLWEGWDIGDPTYGGGTYNHGWTGGPLTLLHQYVTGLEPLEPGYARFRVRPQPGPLRRVSAQAETVRGRIQTSLEREQDQTRLTVNVPPGTTAEVSVPQEPGRVFRRITLNGRTVWQSGRGHSSAFRSADATHLFFAVAAGNWTLIGTY